jgi:hypothetical protein
MEREGFLRSNPDQAQNLRTTPPGLLRESSEVRNLPEIL